jgi:UDP-xylose/UDP-N-acetylglucosamine transporter B4
MGLHTESIYHKYGPQWRENLFFTHALSLPLFIPMFPSMVQQARGLVSSPPIFAHLVAGQSTDMWGISLTNIPSQVVFLIINVLTQSVCIRGVNLLAAVSSALTVTIMLNVRKLLSLLLSLWLFGNRLAFGTLVGAIIVFVSGALYTLDSKQSTFSNKDVK